MAVFRYDSIETIVGSFFLDDDVPISFVPSSVTLTITAPDGTVTTKVWPAATDVLHHTVHEWYYDLRFTQRGTWQVVWLCVGQFTDGNGDVRQYREPVTQRLRCKT